jgi:hypothetical protein
MYRPLEGFKTRLDPSVPGGHGIRVYRGRLGQRRNSRERARAEAPAAANYKGRVSLISSQKSAIMVARASTCATKLYDRRQASH